MYFILISAILVTVAGLVAGRRLVNVLTRVLSVLERIAESLERIAAENESERRIDKGDSSASSGERDESDPLKSGVNEIRRLIELGKWDEAEALVNIFVRDHPETPHAQTITVEIAEARRSLVERFKSRIDEARKLNDADQVVLLRDELTRHLVEEERKSLDRELIQWIMRWLQNRLRAARVDLDLVEFAARAAESFAETAEGASLNAALPTLRRSAGLCGRCGAPYQGSADACPSCRARALKVVETSRSATEETPASTNDSAENGARSTEGAMAEHGTTGENGAGAKTGSTGEDDSVKNVSGDLLGVEFNEPLFLDPTAQDRIDSNERRDVGSS
jgi:hypothetical protein